MTTHQLGRTVLETSGPSPFLVSPARWHTCVPSDVEGEPVHWFLLTTPARTHWQRASRVFRGSWRRLSVRPALGSVHRGSQPASRAHPFPSRGWGGLRAAGLHGPGLSLPHQPSDFPPLRLQPFSMQNPNVPQASTNLRTGCVQHCVSSLGLYKMPICAEPLLYFEIF